MNIFTGGVSDREAENLVNLVHDSKVSAGDLMLYLIERECIRWTPDEWASLVEFLKEERL
jgi:hypothetical protein